MILYPPTSWFGPSIPWSLFPVDMPRRCCISSYLCWVVLFWPAESGHEHWRSPVWTSFRSFPGFRRLLDCDPACCISARWSNRQMLLHGPALVLSSVLVTSYAPCCGPMSRVFSSGNVRHLPRSLVRFDRPCHTRINITWCLMSNRILIRVWHGSGLSRKPLKHSLYGKKYSHMCSTIIYAMRLLINYVKFKTEVLMGRNAHLSKNRGFNGPECTFKFKTEVLRAGMHI